MIDPVQYVLENPSARLADVARIFSISHSTLISRLKRAGAYVRFDPLRRKRRPEGAPTKFKPLGPELAAAMEIAVANSKEPLRAIAGRFGMPVQTLRYALRHRGLWVRRKRGSQWSAQRKAQPKAMVEHHCHVCGETDPGKFHKSLARRSGLQGKCKVCMRRWSRDHANRAREEGDLGMAIG